MHSFLSAQPSSACVAGAAAAVASACAAAIAASQGLRHVHGVLIYHSKCTTKATSAVQNGRSSYRLLSPGQLEQLLPVSCDTSFGICAEVFIFWPT
jgi:hypothetical protein